MLAFNLWLRDSFRDNKPFDRMVEELVTAQGSIYTNGPANYFRVATGPDDLAETTAQVFMGVRLQCAKCHHHPFEAYGQDDYYGLAAYFARVRTKNSQEFGLFGREQVIYVAGGGEVRQPRSGKVMEPTPLNDEPVDDPVDRRRALAQWLTEPDNPWLARNVANRYWGYLMGRGLVEPIDDLRETNPPTNPELLDALAGHFVSHGYDLKALLRLILNSQVYQLQRLADARQPARRPVLHPLPPQAPDRRATARRDQLRDRHDREVRRSGRAGPAPSRCPTRASTSYFLDTFGRPLRVIACECERSTDPNLSQALHLMNGDLVNRKLADPKTAGSPGCSRTRRSSDRRRPDPQRSTWSRSAGPPRPTSWRPPRGLIAEAPDRPTGAQDLLWGLMNSKEFLFNH